MKQYTTFVQETVSKIQFRIVELEVRLRLAEDENGNLNKDLDELEEEHKTARGASVITLSKQIETKKHEIEKSEEEIELLEREQRYYKQQLESGSIEPVK